MLRTKRDRGSGGTGRRARLRGVWFTPYGFKSRFPHHNAPTKKIFGANSTKKPRLRGFFAFLGNFGLCQQKSQTVDISTLFFGSDGT